MKKINNIVPFPILSMEAMAREVFDADNAWEPAMSFPFPANPTSKLLSEARRQALIYLNWITSDNGIASAGPDWAVDAIRRACTRLIEITELFPYVFDAEREAEITARCDKECLETVEQYQELSALSPAPPKGDGR